jgi:hypothetical protein
MKKKWTGEVPFLSFDSTSSSLRFSVSSLLRVPSRIFAAKKKPVDFRRPKLFQKLKKCGILSDSFFI